jgi:hypothetical protein
MTDGLAETVEVAALGCAITTCPFRIIKAVRRVVLKKLKFRPLEDDKCKVPIERIGF